MKKYILLLLTICSVSAYAQDTIYKCTSSKGEITYINIAAMANKSNGCIKTDLGNIDKSNNTNFKKTVEKNNNTTNEAMFVVNPDQKDRESKRNSVLQKEMEDEKEQLLKINNTLKMLNEAKVIDKKAIEENNILKNQHEKNIESLQKELGKKELPTSLPLTSAPVKFDNSNKNENKIVVGK